MNHVFNGQVVGMVIVGLDNPIPREMNSYGTERGGKWDPFHSFWEGRQKGQLQAVMTNTFSELVDIKVKPTLPSWIYRHSYHYLIGMILLMNYDLI